MSYSVLNLATPYLSTCGIGYELTEYLYGTWNFSVVSCIHSYARQSRRPPLNITSFDLTKACSSTRAVNRVQVLFVLNSLLLAPRQYATISHLAMLCTTCAEPRRSARVHSISLQHANIINSERHCARISTNSEC